MHVCVIALGNAEKLQKKGSPDLILLPAIERNWVQFKSPILQSLAPTELHEKSTLQTAVFVA